MSLARAALALVALVCVAQAGVVVVLDDFQSGTLTRQTIIDSFDGSTVFPVNSQLVLNPASNIVGTERDLSMTTVAAANGQSVTSSIGAGRWTIFTPGGDIIESSSTYQLDGIDGDAFTINVNNLDIDFTVAGTASQLEVTATSDQDTNYLFTLFASGDASTFVEFDLFISSTSFDTQFVMPFTSFTGSSGFDFTSVGALQIVANANRLPDVDADITFLGITANQIEGVVFFDCNQNGVDDFGEIGYPNVQANLLDGADNILASAISGTDGSFTIVTGPGTYRICLVGSTFSTPTIPSSGCSTFFTLAPSEDRFGDTFGCYVPVDVTAPPTQSLDCTACITASNSCTGVATAVGCDSSVTVSSMDSRDVFCEDTFTITRTWTATDGFSTDSEVQIISVTDDTPPNFTSFPNTFTAACGDPLDPNSTGGAPSADDDCSIATVSYFDDSSAGCTAPIAREWTATDACGNAVVQTQSIIVSDLDPPVFTFEPEDAFTECGVPTDTGTATAMDECNVGDTDVTPSDGPVTGSCPEQFTRTWTATDACSNTAIYQQIIFTDDTVAPNLSVPPTATVECGGSIAPADTNGPATATDSCVAPFVTFTDTTSGNSCTSGVQRVWSASDECNVTFGTQQINILDEDPPTFTSFPTDAPIDCNASIDPVNTGAPAATDVCSGLDIITFADSLSSGTTCSNSFTRVWVATDFCDNAVTSLQIISRTDTTPPVLTIPADVTIECSESPTDTGLTGVASATDDCSGVTVSESVSFVSSAGCTDLFARTFIATDSCGFTDVATQNISSTDNEAPDFQNFPDTATVQCTSESGAASVSPTLTGEPDAVDNCDQFPSITFSDVETNNLCPDGIDIQRTWVVSDSCGNSFSQVQEIDIVNLFNPSVVAPDNIQIDCSAVSDPSNTGTATVSGVCDPALTATFTDTISGNGCNQLITRTWTATNACGNSGSDIQTITLTDSAAPTLEPFPADVSIGCEQGSSPMETGTPTIADNCDPTPFLTFSDVLVQPGPVNGVCPSPITVTRTWTGVDACDNVTTRTQTIVVSQEAPTACIPVECAPVACDTSDCPTSDCSCCSDEVEECTAVDCLAAPCGAVSCTAVPCLNCPTSSSAGSVGCTPVACQPVTIYFDDDDYYENQDLINAFQQQQQQ